MIRSASARTFAALVGLAVSASAATAAPITFIHTAVDGSGSIGDIDFVRKDITITAVGDTAARVDFDGGFAIQHISASISIQDVGAFDFLIPTRTFVNNIQEVVGFSHSINGGVSGADLVYCGVDPSLAAWDMLSPIGPVPGSGEFLQWAFQNVLTTGGALLFSDNSGLGGTFEAILVPAPASAGMLAIAGIGFARRRRR